MRRFNLKTIMLFVFLLTCCTKGYAATRERNQSVLERSHRYSVRTVLGDSFEDCFKVVKIGDQNFLQYEDSDRIRLISLGQIVTIFETSGSCE